MPGGCFQKPSKPYLLLDSLGEGYGGQPSDRMGWGNDPRNLLVNFIFDADVRVLAQQYKQDQLDRETGQIPSKREFERKKKEHAKTMKKLFPEVPQHASN